ncbi:MAG: heavy metal sensor histidine kinase, partial [Bdellovibrionota bacterium]
EDVESTEELLVDYETEPKALNENRNRETWLLEVWRRGEKKVFSSPMADKSPLGDLSGECKEEKLQYDSTKLSDGLHVRYGCKMTVVNGNHYVIRAARSADRVHEELRQVFLMMALGLPVALLASAVGGYALARRALQPVSRMTDQARSISADKLGERLAVENPNDELGRLATTFNQTFERLERSFEQMKRFSSDASHELRTPLTAMRTMGEVALREKHTESDYREVISSMLEETDRLRHLVDSLLVLSRADAGQLKLNRSETDLAQLARDVIETLEVLAEDKQQRISVPAPAPVMAIVDRAIFRQALINLIDNAIKYSPPKAEIHMAVESSPDGTVITLSDTGPGISREHQDRVFDRFYRVDAARTREQGGTGLGLSITKWAVEVNGGCIELQSDEGKGTRFIIKLPVDSPA